MAHEVIYDRFAYQLYHSAFSMQISNEIKGHFFDMIDLNYFSLSNLCLFMCLWHGHNVMLLRMKSLFLKQFRLLTSNLKPSSVWLQREREKARSIHSGQFYQHFAQNKMLPAKPKRAFNFLCIYSMMTLGTFHNRLFVRNCYLQLFCIYSFSLYFIC